MNVRVLLNIYIVRFELIHSKVDEQNLIKTNSPLPLHILVSSQTFAIKINKELCLNQNIIFVTFNLP